jgi:hypothetical protein
MVFVESVLAELFSRNKDLQWNFNTGCCRSLNGDGLLKVTTSSFLFLFRVLFIRRFRGNLFVIRGVRFLVGFFRGII